jgi:hypothetical protein
MTKKEMVKKLLKMYKDSYYSIGAIEVILNHIDQFTENELRALYFAVESVYNRYYVEQN